MAYLKIVVVMLTVLSYINCGHIGHHLAPVVPHAHGIRYVHVVPPNIRPYAAQVSTFTRFLPGPAFIQRSLFPASVAPIAPVAPFAPAAPGPFLPAPVNPAFTTGHLAPPVYPVAPFAPTGPAPTFPLAAPAPLLPAPFARSLYAAGPEFAPHVHHLAPAIRALPTALHSSTLLD